MRRSERTDPDLSALAADRLRRLWPDPAGGLGAAHGASAGRSWLGDDEDDEAVDLPRRSAGTAGQPQERVSRELEPHPIHDVSVLPPARRFSRVHLAVVGVVVLLGLIWAGWALVRARPVAVAAPSAVVTTAAPTPAPPSSGGAAPGASTSASASLVVHVVGAVRKPGLVRLAAGARVADAITKAGGLRDTADPGELNLAQVLADGQQVVIGTKRHPAGEVRDQGGAAAGGSSPAGGGGSPSGGSGGKVSLNSATSAQLEELPGVGPVTAQKILDWRQSHGRFSRVEELQEIDGIGPKTYARLAPHLTL